MDSRPRLIPDDTPQHLTRLTFIPPDICGYDALRLTITTTESPL